MTDPADNLHTTVLQRLDGWAARAADAPALLSIDAAPVSYATLRRRGAAMRTRLRTAGVPRAARVAVAMSGGPALAAVLVGVTSAAICCPLDPTAPEDRTMRSLMRIGAVVLVTDDGAGPAARAARALGVLVLDAARLDAPSPLSVDDPGPDDPALILQTSGTTGEPKCVILTHRNLGAGAANVVRALDLAEDDRGVCPMPLFHVHGIVAGLLAPLWSGGSVACVGGADIARVAGAVAGLRATWITAVPTIHAALVDHFATSATRPRLRFVRSASSALPRRLAERLAATFDAPVVEAYGMTEATHQVTSQHRQASYTPPGSVGVAIGIELCVLGVDGVSVPAGTSGEVAVRGPGVAQHFESVDDAGRVVQRFRHVDEWFRTGDAGTLDASGHLWLHGRLVQFIDRGGEKIAPREIEDALLEHESIAAAAVLPTAHPTLGQEIAAAVVAHAGAAVDVADLRRFLLDRLPARNVPKEVLVLDALPTGASGKVDRAALGRLLDASRVRAFVAPHGERETVLADFFGDLLATPVVAADDGFFALGGDSLSAMQLLARIEKRYRVKLALRTLFEHDTPAALAAIVGAPSVAQTMTAAVPPPIARRVRRPG
jgi:acyl-CoA synthetase (AMP-forming)/AMP-acid ligase II/acyl carrier protein